MRTWQCNKGHEWSASLTHIKDKGPWCPYCASTARLCEAEDKKIEQELMRIKAEKREIEKQRTSCSMERLDAPGDEKSKPKTETNASQNEVCQCTVTEIIQKMVATKRKSIGFAPKVSTTDKATSRKGIRAASTETTSPGPAKKCRPNLQQGEKNWNANYEAIDKMLWQEKKESVDHEWKLPIQRSKNVEERRLAIWFNNQFSILGKTFQRNQSQKKKIDLINKLKERQRRMTDSEWEDNYASLKNATSTPDGKCIWPNRHSTNLEERRIAAWFNHQKKILKGKLTKNEEGRLHSLEKLYQDVQDELWDENYAILKRRADGEGTWPKQDSTNPEEKKIALWFITQRRMLQEKLIRNAVENTHLSLLEKLRKQVADTSWNAMFAKILKFSWIQSEGVEVDFFWPRQTSNNEDERKIAIWIKNETDRQYDLDKKNKVADLENIFKQTRRTNEEPLLKRQKQAGDVGSHSQAFSAEETLSSLSSNSMSTSSRSLMETIQSSSQTVIPGAVGLKNLGNTCYMNSAIQCLSNIPSLRDFFVTGDYLKTLNPQASKTKGKLAQAFAELLQEMWAGKGEFVVPSNLKDVISRFSNQFEDGAQEDSMELLEYLIDGIGKDCNKIKGQQPYKPNEEVQGCNEEKLEKQALRNYMTRNKSRVNKYFLGFLSSVVTCPIDEPQCGRKCVTMDPYTSVKLELPKREDKPLKLQELLRNFVREETLRREDAWYCDNCKEYKEAAKKLEFRTVPPVLVLQFKRFKYNELESKRIDTPIDFPLEGLDMKPFCTKTAGKQRNQEFLYDLVSIIDHYGTV